MKSSTWPRIRWWRCSRRERSLVRLRLQVASFLTRPGPFVTLPIMVTLPITVGLTAVGDLTDPAESAAVDTNAQELTGDWRSYATRIPPAAPPTPHSGVPPTHSLGIALHGLGKHQGLITFSATLPDYRILVVFPDRLLKGSTDFLQYSFHDDRGALQIKRIP